MIDEIFTVDSPWMFAPAIVTAFVFHLAHEFNLTDVVYTKQ
jgi:hypothetical protein